MPREPAPHAVLVLAAGHSRRLGQPKQLLRIGGETLLARTVRLAAATQPAQVLVALPSHLPALAAEVDPALARAVWIDDATRGKATTLERVAQALPDGPARVLILCADHPGLEADHLQRLLRAARDAPSGTAATAYADGAGEPAVLPLARVRQFRAAVADQGLRDALQGPEVARVAAPAALDQLRVDTPEGLAAARRGGRVDNDA